MVMGQRVTGFTLLELMVVLLILALGAAVATPAVMRMVDSLSEREERDALATYLGKLPVVAMNTGQTFTLPRTRGYVAARSGLGDLPGGGPAGNASYPKVWVPDDIEFRPNGACSGGIVHWELESGQRFSQLMNAPLCQPEVGG